MIAASSLKRSIMATAQGESRKVLEGVFAVNKPQWASSAGVLRDLQAHFASSPLFAPWLESQRRAMYLAHSKPNHINNLKVKLGHGGTLDPMATGVLIVGVGKGTKYLGKFLECTKSYECVVLFGAATDSYDAVGKVVSKAPYAHVTRELVEEKLAQFRGKILQKPSVFSALKVDGKKMYEYAREGKDIPEVAARPVEVEALDLVEWLEPSTHDFTWPKEEMEDTEMQGAEKLLGIRKEDANFYADNAASRGRKRQRSWTPEDHVEGAGEQPKQPRTDSEPAMSGALPAQDGPTGSALSDGTTQDVSTQSEAAVAAVVEENSSKPIEEDLLNKHSTEQVPASNGTTASPPAARLRMTVTSGFYVRSLCHDLGLACSSLGMMSSLVRTRQGAYSLGDNVLEWSDFGPVPEMPSTAWLAKKDHAKDATEKTEPSETESKAPEYQIAEPMEEVPTTTPELKPWESKLEGFLQDFMQQEGWEAEELDDEETWNEKKREERRDRSYQGGNQKRQKYNGGWGNKRGYYSKKMDGRGGSRD